MVFFFLSRDRPRLTENLGLVCTGGSIYWEVRRPVIGFRTGSFGNG